jgi:mono/diheme cytochrome c family protein
MAGSTIGPQMRQMNRMVGGANQIDTLKALAFFDKPPSQPYPEALVAPYAGQAGTPPASATLEQRVRSYMEANCAFCHRPDGDFTNLDLRFDIAFKDTNLCNVDPLQGDVGMQGSKNLVPMMPMQSVAWLRMNALPNEGRMPQIGTYQVDAAGVKLMGDWIASVKSCP